MLNEYLDQLKSFITTNTYFVVDDALDSLVCLFDELLAGKKRSCPNQTHHGRGDNKKMLYLHR